MRVSSPQPGHAHCHPREGLKFLTKRVASVQNAAQPRRPGPDVLARPMCTRTGRVCSHFPCHSRLVLVRRRPLAWPTRCVSGLMTCVAPRDDGYVIDVLSRAHHSNADANENVLVCIHLRAFLTASWNRIVMVGASRGDESSMRREGSLWYSQKSPAA